VAGLMHLGGRPAAAEAMFMTLSSSNFRMRARPTSSRLLNFACVYGTGGIREGVHDANRCIR
jgi:hypothetical protein